MKRSTDRALLAGMLLLSSTAVRSEEPSPRVSTWEVEAGFLQTENMEIHGYQQGNATDGWDSTIPTARLEYWWNREDAWDYGVVLQPIFASYSGTFQNDLNAKGQFFKAGEKGTLDYQFHSLRFSANYPVLTSQHGNYLRLGGSLVARYADVRLKSATASIDDTNFIVVPLINVESDVALGSRHSLFFRTDFLPGIQGSLFLDGLYDVLLAFRTPLERSRNVDFGVRLFFGGYDPDEVDEYANRIFFAGVVGRYTFR
jgi:DivIVA domain-containing protein